MATIDELIAEREKALGAQPKPQLPQVQLPQQQAAPAQQAAGPSIDDAIAAREAELQQGGGGFSSGLGQAVTATFGQGVESGVENFLGGANQRIAQLLSLPGAAVDEALKAAGVEIFAGADPSQTGLNTFSEMFKQAGINTEPQDGMMADMGRSSIDTALTTAALFAAAPALAAQTGKDVASFIAQDLGKFIQANPGLFAAGELASVPGSVVGTKAGSSAGALVDEAVGSDKKIGENLGGMLGGTAGGIVTGMAAPMLAKGLRSKNVGPLGEPVDPQGSPAEVTRFAQEQVAGDLAKVDKSIGDAVNLVKSARTPEEGSVAVRKGLEDAYRGARAAEDQFWSRVDKTAKIDPAPIRDAVIQLRNDTVLNGSPSTFPADIAKNLLGADKGRRITGVSAEFLLNARSEIRRAIRAEDAKPGSNRGLVANLEGLDKVIMDQLADQLPDNQALAAARQFSYDLNERFTRGPVADVLRQRYGGDLVDPGQTMQALLAKHGTGGSGVAAALDVAKGVPGAPQTAKPDLVPDMEDAVRSQFQQIILSDDPEKVRTAANAFLTKHKSQIKELGSVAGEIQQAVDGLTTGLKQRDVIRKSALAKYADTAPEKVVSGIFSSKNPRKAAQELLSRGMAKDADAIDGLRSQTIKHIIRQSLDTKGNLSPAKFRNNLNPKYYSAANDAYREIFSPEQMNALRSIAADGVEADETMFGKGVRAATMLGRIAGNVLTGMATKAIGAGGGSIQLHAMGSKLAGEFTERQFKRMPAGELIELAILDPSARAILRRRAPSTAAEMRAIAARLRAITAAGNSAMQLGEEDK